VLKKTCFRCGIEKCLDEFHRHAQMKDGHLNKCAQCTVTDVRSWRRRQPGGPSADRQKRYAREIEMGRRVRLRAQSEIIPMSPEVRRSVRKIVSLRYSHKRKAQVAWLSEFDRLVIDKVFRICQQRKLETGIDWHLDHIVPLNHRHATGLHNAFNVQPVPASWNVRKCNCSMDEYPPSVAVMETIRSEARAATSSVSHNPEDNSK
jgi:hypothetical protein